MKSLTAQSSVGKAVLVLCGLLLSLSVLELALRVYASLASQERLIIADSVLGWKLIPHAKKLYRKEAQPYFVAINSKGLRDREHSYDKPPDVFRIVVLGDSMVFGAGGVEASNRFTDILERSAKKLEVINMGIPAFGADQEYLYLQTEGLKYDPDLVIICAFSNDFGESFSTINPSNGRPKGYFSLSAGRLVFHPPTFLGFYELAQHSYVLGLADLALTKVSGVYRKAWGQRQDVLDPPTRVKVFKQLYASAGDLCRQRGAELVLVYFPFSGQNSKWIIQQVIEELAATKDMKTLDLMDTMLHANATRPSYFEHDIHFNEYGHEVVARALLEYLVKGGLLNSAGPEFTK